MHTTGKWIPHFKLGYAGARVSDDQGRSICAFPSNSKRDPNEVEANIHLIANAPQMYAVLIEMAEYFRNGTPVQPGSEVAQDVIKILTNVGLQLS